MRIGEISTVGIKDGDQVKEKEGLWVGSLRLGGGGDNEGKRGKGRESEYGRHPTCYLLEVPNALG